MSWCVLPPSTLWHAGDKLRLWFLGLLSLSGTGVSWWKVSGSADTGTQLRWVEVGVVATMLAGVAGALWLAAGRRALRRRVRPLLQHLSMVLMTAEDADGADATAAAPATSCTTPRMTTYHRPGCMLVRGKAVTWGSMAEQRLTGRRPCGVCRP
jgi:hypothetical protein